MEELISGRRVLITGAGGSIGAELVRQVSELGPAHLSLLDNSEYNLFTIDRQLAESQPEQSRDASIADVRDRSAIERLFAELRPDIVFHAAALKHVPMVEANPLEDLRQTPSARPTCSMPAAGPVSAFSSRSRPTRRSIRPM